MRKKEILEAVSLCKSWRSRSLRAGGLSLVIGLLVFVSAAQGLLPLLLVSSITYPICMIFWVRTEHGFRVRARALSKVLSDSNLLVGRVGFGNCMAPTILKGDILLCRKFEPGKGSLQESDVVVARPNLRQRLLLSRPLVHALVKRVAEINGTDVWLVGDNAEESADSRQLGYFSLDQIKGIIIEVIRQQG